MLNIKQLAEKLHVTERTIRRWVSEKEMPHTRSEIGFNRTLLFDENVVMAWMKERQ